MPQFDFSTYGAQIFWFALCFGVLYYFMHNVILPRIRNIIAERKAIVGADLASVATLEESITELRLQSDNLSLQANSKYKTAMENAVKDATKAREKAIEDFKINAEKMVQKSHEEIAKISRDAQDKSLVAAQKLAEITENKLLNF